MVVTADRSTHLTGARAAVLARLWGAIFREALPGIARREVAGDTVSVTLADGRLLTGPAAAVVPFASAIDGLFVRMGGEWYDDPAELAAVLPLGRYQDRFVTELADSVANLALARSVQPRPDGGPLYLSRRPSLAALEQCVIDGHPLHPLCRTRLGMSSAEVAAYAPEHRPVVALMVYRVPADRWHSTGAGMPPLLPVHPWQASHLLTDYPFCSPTGITVLASPLMSLRTLALRDDSRYHLKTAVDVQMTSAVRTISPAAVHNGPLLSGWLTPLAARAGIQLLREVSGGAVLVGGAPARSLAVLRREAPVPGPGEVVLPLAVLSAPSPASGRALLTELPRSFLDDLLTLLLPALLKLLSAGVALEAHGQNTLVAVRDGVPVRILYRDLGGIRVLPSRLDKAGIDPPPVLGDLIAPDEDALRTKLYAAVSTVVGELASTAAREFGEPPAVLWGTAADVVRGAVDADAGDVSVLLGPVLPVKATTMMRLAGDPLSDRFTTLDNPMAQR